MIIKTKRHPSPLLLTFSVISLLVQSPTMGAVIFTESFGTVGGDTAISTHETANGFDNDGFTFSGNGEIRNTQVSTTEKYPAASGGANAYLKNTAATDLVISGISTLGYTAGTVGISFGAWKANIAPDMTTLIFEFSTDTLNWSAISIPAQPTGTNTAN
jgi:hypothetical protein